MHIAGHDIAICSWSLQPKSMSELVRAADRLGIRHVQLMLLDLLQMDPAKRAQELGVLRTAGLALTAGMLSFPGEDYATIATIRETGGFVPDGLWAQRKALAADAARFAAGELGVKAIGTHVGFIPPATDPAHGLIVDRIEEIAADFAHLGLELHMETGQEPAGELREFVRSLKASNVFVNFDPANMILYGAGDPIEAIRVLGPLIRHVHVKDATASAEPTVQWGEEVPFGTGQVPVEKFIAALKQAGYAGPLAFEREAGTSREADIAGGIAALKSRAGV